MATYTTHSSYTHKNIYFPSLYLDSPVIDVRLRAAARILRESGGDHKYTPTDWTGALKQDWRVLQEALKSGANEIRVADPKDYSRLFDTYKRPVAIVGREMREVAIGYHKIINAVAEEIGANAYNACSPNAMLHATCSTAYIDQVRKFTYWEQVLGEYARRMTSGARGIARIGSEALGRVMIMSDSLCYIYDKSLCPVGWLMTYEQVLLLKDSCYSRANATLASLTLYPDTNMTYLAHQLWKWQEHALDLYGNEGYEIAKSTESLSKAYMSRIAGDILSGPDDSYARMMKKVDAKEDKIRVDLKMSPTTSHMSSEFHMILTSCKEISHVVELFGLQKCSGHPLIDPRRGGMSAAKEALSSDRTLPSDAYKLRNTFRHLLVTGYIAKHHEWPSITFGDKDTSLRRLFLRNELRLHRSMYDLSDWNDATFNKNFDLDNFDNYLELMDDKSISYGWKDRLASWDHKTKASSERRLLLELLLNMDSFKPSDIIRLVEENRIPKDWFIVSLCPKEREFKLAARMFSMLVFPMRCFFTIHEANLAETILPLFPQLTMTDSRLEVTQRFLKLTRPEAHPDVAKLFLELDLSRWNLRWREYVVHLVGQDLNRLFGCLHVFTTAHSFFSSAHIMVRVNGLMPEGIDKDEPPVSDLHWIRHLGGFEGICQKLWSLCTVAMIDMAIHDLNLAYTLTIQGDNVTVAVTVPRDPSVSERDQTYSLKEEITKRCAAACASVNQDLKPEECLESTRVITYSKDVFINGVDYFTSLKALSRLFPTSPVDFPSIGVNVGAIFSGAVAAAERLKTPIVGYYLALHHASHYLLRCNTIPGPYLSGTSLMTRGMSKQEVEYTLLNPPELGGFPVLGYMDFLYRGGADPLSKSLSSLWTLKDKLYVASGILYEATEDRFFSKHPTLQALVQDPYGLPIDKPTSPSQSVAASTLEVLRSSVKNKDIGDVLRADLTAYTNHLLAALKKLTPFNPTIARDIWDCSVLGAVDTISKMFLTTRTIQTLSRKTGGENLSSVLISAGAKEIRYILKRAAKFKPCTKLTHTSLYDYCRSLRRRWEAVGVSIEGLTSYHPVDFPFSTDPAMTGTEIRCSLIQDCADPRYHRGPETAYVGSRTREKRAEQGYKIVGGGTSTSAVLKLQSIMTQCNHSAGMLDILDYAALSRGDLRLSTVSHLLARVSGGSMSHRYAARIGERDAYILGQISIASHCVLDSNYAGYLSGSKEDYPVMFQEFFLYLIARADHLYDPASRNLITKVIIGNLPLDILPTAAMDVSDPSPLPDIPIPRSHLVYDPGLRLVRATGPSRYSIYGVTTVAIDHPDLPLLALISRIKAALGSPRAILSVMETQEALSPLKIDLLEILGLGLETYINAVAICILDLYDSTFANQERAIRYRSELLAIIRGLARPLLHGIEPLLRHPYMKDDPLVMQLNIGLGPRYDSGSGRLGALISTISSTVHKFLDSPSSLYYKSPLICFPDDSPNTLSSSLITAAKRISRHQFTSDIVTYDEMYRSNGILVATIRGGRYISEEDKVLSVYNLLVNELVADRPAHPPVESIAVEWANLANGRHRCSPKMSPLSSTEILRIVRGHAIIPRRYSYKVAPVRGSLLPVAVVRWGIQGIDPARYQYSLGTRLQRSYWRAQGMPSPYSSHAYLVYRRVLACISYTRLYIVGAGLGGAALASLEHGCRSVTGLDLSRDVQNDAGHLHGYAPPLVRLSRYSDCYSQSVLNVTTSGDWDDPFVATEFLRRIQKSDLLVIDYQPDLESSSLRPFRELINCKWRGNVLYRYRGALTGHMSLLGLLPQVCKVKATWTVIDTQGGCTEWLYLCCQFVPHTLQQACRGYDCNTSCITPYRLEPNTYLPYTLWSVFGCLGVDCSLAPEEVMESSIGVFRALAGEYASRAVYHEWTKILEALFAAEWYLGLHNDDEQAGHEPYLRTLMRWESGATVQSALFDSIQFSPSKYLIWYCAKSLSRYLSPEP